jgi:acetoin utilization deacetylase AcuC-like enzyme/GNAT superfamily N-acetyltransferase
VIVFRIRRIHDGMLPAERDIVERIQSIIREQFPLVPEADVALLPEQLRDPFRFRYRTVIFAALGERGRLKGFATLLWVPDLRFCYLDFVTAARLVVGRGVGGALYQRVREEALGLGGSGLFFECLPDDPATCRVPEIIRQNAARLRFYESYGARPIVGTAYETPLKPTSECPPFLVFDDLGRGEPLRRDRAREIVRAILERKYHDYCTPAYVDMVVESFRDDPVVLREPRYRRREKAVPVVPQPSLEKRIVLVVSDAHRIHHVKERGYVECPARIDSILREIEPTGLFERHPVKHFPGDVVRAVHDPEFVGYLKRVCAAAGADDSVYPYVFPIRNRARPPWDLAMRAGYYCIDTFTPLNGNAYVAARRAVDCALTAAATLLEGPRVAYALVRPPGHHAERRSFGGFCYLNSTAIAAHYLSSYGTVAVLDLDYHHGNGTQDIFYQRSDVLTLSIHGHPHFAYPYFTGFADERGEGAGAGYNWNFPLAEAVDGPHYARVLDEACRRIEWFRPAFLVVALGLDTVRGDPTGSWSLRARDLEANGRRVGALGVPTLVVQEGGYSTRRLGTAARRFLSGLAATAIGQTLGR